MRYFLFIFAVLSLLFLQGHSVGGSDINKVDDQACNGHLGVVDSACFRLETLDDHVHAVERWFSISGDQSGADWNESVSDAGMPDMFVATSGNGTYGTGDGPPTDEAEIIGTDDTCGIAGMTKYDLHRILIMAASETTIFIIRIVYGTGTMDAAVSASQYSELMVKRDTAIGESHGIPITMQMPRLTWGTDKVWIQVKNVVDDSTISFFVGLHCYEL